MARTRRGTVRTEATRLEQLASEMKLTSIDRQLRLEGQRGRAQLARVDALERRHPLVLAQRPVELSAADVDRGDPGGAALEQAVGEAAGRGADVEAVEAADVDPEGVEGGVELEPAAGDESAALLDLDPLVGGDQLPRLRRPLAAAADPDEAGADRARRRGAGRGEAALGQQRVEADASRQVRSPRTT